MLLITPILTPILLILVLVALYWWARSASTEYFARLGARAAAPLAYERGQRYTFTSWLADLSLHWARVHALLTPARESELESLRKRATTRWKLFAAAVAATPILFVLLVSLGRWAGV